MGFTIAPCISPDLMSCSHAFWGLRSCCSKHVTLTWRSQFWEILNNFPLSTFLCAYACTHVYAFTHVYVCAAVEIRCFPQLLSTLFIKAWSLPQSRAHQFWSAWPGDPPCLLSYHHICPDIKWPKLPILTLCLMNIFPPPSTLFKR